MSDGARKYGPYNWREEGVGAMTYLSAAERHIRAWLDGEEEARDSGVHHLGHAAACLMILMDAQAVGNLVDDRPAPAPTNDLLEQIKAGGEAEDAPLSEAAVVAKVRGLLNGECPVCSPGVCFVWRKDSWPQKLKLLLEKEKITQAEYDAYVQAAMGSTSYFIGGCV